MSQSRPIATLAAISSLTPPLAVVEHDQVSDELRLTIVRVPTVGGFHDRHGARPLHRIERGASPFRVRRVTASHGPDRPNNPVGLAGVIWSVVVVLFPVRHGGSDVLAHNAGKEL